VDPGRLGPEVVDEQVLDPEIMDHGALELRAGPPIGRGRTNG
jgi:hypothetical protein